MASLPPVKAGAVVLVRFPFSDLSAARLRPAVVLAEAGRPYADPRAVELDERAFSEGSLERVSYVRPGKLFTANESLIVRRVGTLTAVARAEVVTAVIALLRGDDEVNEPGSSFTE